LNFRSWLLNFVGRSRVALPPNGHGDLSINPARRQGSNRAASDPATPPGKKKLS